MVEKAACVSKLGLVWDEERCIRSLLIEEGNVNR